MLRLWRSNVTFIIMHHKLSLLQHKLRKRTLANGPSIICVFPRNLQHKLFGSPQTFSASAQTLLHSPQTFRDHHLVSELTISICTAEFLSCNVCRTTGYWYSAVMVRSESFEVINYHSWTVSVCLGSGGWYMARVWDWSQFEALVSGPSTQGDFDPQGDWRWRRSGPAVTTDELPSCRRELGASEEACAQLSSMASAIYLIMPEISPLSARCWAQLLTVGVQSMPIGRDYQSGPTHDWLDIKVWFLSRTISR
jgi:hypothetical protein